MIAAAFIPSLQLAALVAGFASVVSFLYLAVAVGSFNEQVNRVVIVDKVAVICLVVGAVLFESVYCQCQHETKLALPN